MPLPEAAPSFEMETDASHPFGRADRVTMVQGEAGPSGLPVFINLRALASIVATITGGGVLLVSAWAISLTVFGVVSGAMLLALGLALGYERS